MNKRNGKIARLPKDLRELVNRMLDDGAQYRSIMNELEKHRHRWPDDIKEFTDGNFTEWHQGGYQDWVREQEFQHDLAARREYAHAIGESTPSGNVSEAVHEIGTLHLYHFLTSIDRAALETKIRDDPAACARLVNAFARLRPAGWRGALRMLERLALLAVAPMPVIAARIAQGLFPAPDQAELRAAAVASLSRNDKRAYLAGVRAVTRFDVRRRLAEIRCPTLIVAGGQDTTVPRAASDLLRRRIPDARLVVVPGSGHATPYDRPDLFNQLVLEFVARH